MPPLRWPWRSRVTSIASMYHSSGYPPSRQWWSSVIPVMVLHHSSDGSLSIQWLSSVTQCVITPVRNQPSLNFDLCLAIWLRLLIAEMVNSWTWALLINSKTIAVFGCHKLLRWCTYYVIIIQARREGGCKGVHVHLRLKFINNGKQQHAKWCLQDSHQLS